MKLNFVPEPLRLTINLIDRHLDCKKVCCNECSLWVTLASGSCMKRHSFPTLSTSATSTGHHRDERQGPAPIVLALAFVSTSSKPITTPKISLSSSAAFILDGLTLQAYRLVHFELSQVLQQQLYCKKEMILSVSRAMLRANVELFHHRAGGCRQEAFKRKLWKRPKQ